MGRNLFGTVILLANLCIQQTNCMDQKLIQKTTRFTKHTDELRGIKSFDDEKILSFGAKSFLLWDAKQRQSKHVIQATEPNLQDVEKFDSDKILSSSQTDGIKLWDMQQQCVHKFEKKIDKNFIAGTPRKLDKKQ